MAEYQIRSDEGETTNYPTLEAAMERANDDPFVWKVSFNAEGGERVRLVRRSVLFQEDVWVYEPIVLSEVIEK